VMPETPVPQGFHSPWGRVVALIENDVGDRFYRLASDGVGDSLLPALMVEDAWGAFLEVQRKEFEKTHA